MVVLPNASKAEINPAKVRDYLLSSSHPIGRFKQPFFVALASISTDPKKGGDLRGVEAREPLSRSISMTGC